MVKLVDALVLGTSLRVGVRVPPGALRRGEMKNTEGPFVFMGKKFFIGNDGAKWTIKTSIAETKSVYDSRADAISHAKRLILKTTEF